MCHIDTCTHKSGNFLCPRNQNAATNSNQMFSNKRKIFPEHSRLHAQDLDSLDCKEMHDIIKLLCGKKGKDLSVYGLGAPYVNTRVAAVGRKSGLRGARGTHTRARARRRAT